MSKKINIAVVGATGFTGLELILLLSKHPHVNIKNLCATKKLGKKISFFDNRIKKKLPKITSINKIIWSEINLLFLALPNGEAQKLINSIFNKHKKIKFIDLSADFRLVDAVKYKKSLFSKRTIIINKIKKGRILYKFNFNKFNLFIKFFIYK